MAVLAGTMFLGLLFPASPASAFEVCTEYDGYPRVYCHITLRSHSSGWVKLGPACGRPRNFDAYDRSKRVDLRARGEWIAPGTMRFLAYGSPLGPLRGKAKLRSGKHIDFYNRSRFPVMFDFYVDCP